MGAFKTEEDILMRTILFLTVLLVCGVVSAEEKRVAVDDSAFPDKAKFIWAMENIIQTNNGDKYVKVKYENGEAVADVPANLDIATLITQQTISAEIAKETARIQAVMAAEQTKKAADKQDILNKLRISEADLKTLKILLEDLP